MAKLKTASETEKEFIKTVKRYMRGIDPVERDTGMESCISSGKDAMKANSTRIKSQATDIRKNSMGRPTKDTWLTTKKKDKGTTLGQMVRSLQGTLSGIKGKDTER